MPSDKIDLLVTYLLVCMFGSSTWLPINAIWVELSLYTNELPEGWSLPSYLAATIQIACIGPLLYSVVHKCTRLNINKPPLILCLLFISTLSLLFLTLFWHTTAWAFGSERSVVIIALTFSMALVSATSNVLFLPYMATFHPNYLTAYFIGMSLSSLIPSVLKLIQGVGNFSCVPDVDANGTVTKMSAIQAQPLFLISHYNLMMVGWMCAATVSFAILHWYFGRKKIKEQKRSTGEGGNQRRENQSFNSPNMPEENDGLDDEQGEQSPLKPKDVENSAMKNAPDKSSASSSIDKKKWRFWMLIFCLSLVCAEMNTIVPSVQSYATLAYSLMTYHLALTFSNLSHPLANFFPLWVKPQSLSIILALTFVCTMGSAFIFGLALQSPNPVFRESMPPLGSSLVISVSVITGFLCSYLRTHITGVIRGEHPDSESRLFWCGFFMQVGSFLGACVMFPLVNVLQIFQKRKQCT